MFITSCKDDTVEPTPVSDAYFNTAQGSSWIFSNYLLSQDSEGEQNLGKNDTLTQGANSNVLGQNAMLMKHYFVNPLSDWFSPSTANYYIYENAAEKKVYVNSDFMKIFLPEMIQTGWNIVFNDSKWFLLADGNAKTEWVLDSFALANVGLPVPGMEGITLNGYLKFGMKRGTDTTIAIANATANTYTLSIFFEGKINHPQYPMLSTMDVRIEFLKINFYFGSKKGLLGISAPISNVTVSVPIYPSGIPLPITFDGFDKRLIGINLK